MAIKKIQRWLDLLAYLTRHHYPVSRAQLMDAIPGYAEALRQGTDPESVRRTFERDKEELLDAGIPLETRELGNEEADEQVGYLLRSRDFYLPYLKLLREGQELPSETRRAPMPLPRAQLGLDDLLAARDALQTVSELPEFPHVQEARAAWRTLRFDAESTPGAQDATGPGAVPVILPSDPAAVSSRTSLLSRALELRKTVKFRYTGAYRDGTEEREVHPYGLLFKLNQWYLVGHDVGRDAIRIFRLSRMDELTMNTQQRGTPDYARPADFTLDPWRKADAWSLPSDSADETEIQVQFDFPQSMLAERNGLGELVSRNADGSQIRTFRARQPDALLRWLLTLRGEARPLHPPQVVDAWRTLVRRVADLYAEDVS
jgi:predicted DNA-binding transcriptional regulator YafY